MDSQEKVQKPFYKKWWVWSIVIVIFPAMCEKMTNSPSQTQVPAANNSINTPFAPVGEKFKSMSPTEHLANAKSALKSNNFNVAKMHLDAIPKEAKEFAKVGDFRKDMDAAQKKHEKTSKLTSDENFMKSMEKKMNEVRTKLKKYYGTADDIRELNQNVALLTVAKAAYANSTESSQKRIYSKMSALLPKMESTLRDTYASSIEEIFVKNGMDIRVNAVSDGKKTLRLKYALMSQPLIYKFQNEIHLDTQAKAIGFKKIIYTNGFESDLGSTWTVKLN